MNKMLLALMFGFMFAQVAQAEEHDWEYQGQKIRFLKMEPVKKFFVSISDERMVPEEMAKKGIFAVAMEVTYLSEKATEIVRQEFLRRGFKLVSKKEDAGVILMFGTDMGVTFDITDVEEDTPFRPYLIEWDSQVMEMPVVMVLSPTVTSDGRIVSGVKDGNPENFDSFRYKRSTDSIRHATVYRMIVGEWIDRYVPASAKISSEEVQVPK